MGLSDLWQGAAVSGHPAQLGDAAGFSLPDLHLVGRRHQVDQHVGLSAPVQSGRCAGLLACPPWRQQKAHCGGVRRVRAGAHPEQRILRSQLQLLCPLVLYAGAHPCGDDRECAGRSQHRSGHPGPGPWLDHAGYAGLCTGARAGQRHRHLVSGCAQEPRPVFRGAGLWPGRIAALPSARNGGQTAALPSA